MMTSFAESCRELMNDIKETELRWKKRDDNVFTKRYTSYHAMLEVARERLVRAQDEVAFLKEINQIEMEGVKGWQKIDKRISDLEAGIKVLEGKA